MKICKDCGNVCDSGAICHECGSVLCDMSAEEEKAYRLRLDRTVSEQSSRSYGLYSTLSDRIFGAVSMFGMVLHGLCLLWAMISADDANVTVYSVTGIVFLLAAAINFLAPRTMWAIASRRIKLISDEKDPQPSALWITTKNFAKYAELAIGGMFLLLSLIEIL